MGKSHAVKRVKKKAEKRSKKGETPRWEKESGESQKETTGKVRSERRERRNKREAEKEKEKRKKKKKGKKGGGKGEEKGKESRKGKKKKSGAKRNESSHDTTAATAATAATAVQANGHTSGPRYGPFLAAAIGVAVRDGIGAVSCSLLVQALSFTAEPSWRHNCRQDPSFLGISRLACAKNTYEWSITRKRSARESGLQRL